MNSGRDRFVSATIFFISSRLDGFKTSHRYLEVYLLVYFDERNLFKFFITPICICLFALQKSLLLS